MGKIQGSGLFGRRPCEKIKGRTFRRRRVLSPARLAKLRERCQVSLEIQSDKSLKGTDQDQTSLVSGIDIQGKLSSDVVTSTSKPQTPSSRELEINQSDKSLKGSDQDQTTLVCIIDVLIEQIKNKDNEIELADIRAELQEKQTELQKKNDITETIMEKLKHHLRVNF